MMMTLYLGNIIHDGHKRRTCQQPTKLKQSLSKIRAVSSKPRFFYFGFHTVGLRRYQQYHKINSILGCSCIDLPDVLNYYKIQLKLQHIIYSNKYEQGHDPVIFLHILVMNW